MSLLPDPRMSAALVDHFGTCVTAGIAVLPVIPMAATARSRHHKLFSAKERHLRLQLRHDRDLQDIADLKVAGHVTTALDRARQQRRSWS